LGKQWGQDLKYDLGIRIYRWLEAKRATLLKGGNVSEEELIQSIVEKPAYDSSNRKKQSLLRNSLKGLNIARV
jgi:hypothetical protein